ncbi:MAG: ATP-binding cassette domain-containing protein [Sphaerobacteraceae bacterium]|nr:MAG: ATP-binding cassette domain-containing protein [Sphaerobacteraceae bacterium]
MLSIQNLSFQHHAASHPALRNISMTVEPGMFVGVVGPSGSGKSTLLRALNGLVPHFHGGKLGGSVSVDGQDTRRVDTAELSQIVGFVSQEPEAQTVFDTVVDEIAFGPENLGLSQREIEQRVTNALRTLKIVHLGKRDISTLSGGERQRVVIAATLAMGSRLLVLDEPLSQLDPWAARDLLETLDELRRSDRVAVIVAEHRIDQLLPHCTHVLELATGESSFGLQSRPAAVYTLQHKPALARLAQIVNWPEIPATIDDARSMVQRNGPTITPAIRDVSVAGIVRLEAHGATVQQSDRHTIADIDLTVPSGTIQAIVGPNGAGKTTILRLLAGLQRPDRGIVRYEGAPVHELSGTLRQRSIGYVPQYPASLFIGETVREEIDIALEQATTGRTTTEVLEAFSLTELAERFSWDISGGERQRLAIAIAVAAEPSVLLLDEPTRGMDATARQSLYTMLDRLKRTGIAIFIATHDMDLVCTTADHVIRLDNGRISSKGTVSDIIGHDPVLQTDVARVFGSSFLTCDQVEAAAQESTTSTNRHPVMSPNSVLKARV